MYFAPNSAQLNVSRPVLGDLIGLSILKKMLKVTEVTETKAFMRGVEALCARDDRCRDVIGLFLHGWDSLSTGPN